jgi:hypothetical protein
MEGKALFAYTIFAVPNIVSPFHPDRRGNDPIMGRWGEDFPQPQEKLIPSKQHDGSIEVSNAGTPATRASAPEVKGAASNLDITSLQGISSTKNDGSSHKLNV